MAEEAGAALGDGGRLGDPNVVVVECEGIIVNSLIYFVVVVVLLLLRFFFCVGGCGGRAFGGGE